MLYLLILALYPVIRLFAVEQELKSGLNIRSFLRDKRLKVTNAIKERHLDKVMRSIRKEQVSHIQPTKREVVYIKNYAFNQKAFDKILLKSNEGMDRKSGFYSKYNLKSQTFYQRNYNRNLMALQTIDGGSIIRVNDHVFHAKDGEILKYRVKGDKVVNPQPSKNPFKSSKTKGMRLIEDNIKVFMDSDMDKIIKKYHKYFLSEKTLIRIAKMDFPDHSKVAYDPPKEMFVTIVDKYIICQYKNKVIHVYNTVSKEKRIYDKGTEYLFDPKGYIYKYAMPVQSHSTALNTAIVSGLTLGLYHLSRFYISHEPSVKFNKIYKSTNQSFELAHNSIPYENIIQGTMQLANDLQLSEHKQKENLNITVANLTETSKAIIQHKLNTRVFPKQKTKHKIVSVDGTYLYVISSLTLFTIVIFVFYDYNKQESIYDALSMTPWNSKGLCPIYT